MGSCVISTPIRDEGLLMDPQDGLVVKPRRGRIIVLIAVLAAVGGLLAAVLVMTLTAPPSLVGGVAGVTFAPEQYPSLEPSLEPSPGPTPTPTPSPTPTPIPLTPYAGRLSGTWLLTQELATDARLNAVFARELLLSVRPRCDAGPCTVTVRLVDPRTEETLATQRVKPDDGYRFSIDAGFGDMCRGADGRTVEGGATRTTSYEIQALAQAGTNDVVLAIEGGLRLEPTKRGKAVGCGPLAYGFEGAAEKLTNETRATVADRLTPIPETALVGRPGFKVSIKGVRMVYYPVKGTSATKLEDAWAEQSSKKKHCGKIDYEWHTGSRRTTSCIKLTWSATTLQQTNAATGSCVVVSVNIDPRYTMPIARWTGPDVVPRGLVTWWKDTQRYVRDHEAGHVKIYRTWIRKLRARLDGVACSKVDAIYKKWNKQVDAAQEAYDKREYARTDWPPRPVDAP
jgi:predicted secreted Zn-dependent protease